MVYRKEESNTRGISKVKIGREYDQIVKLLKKNCYL